MLNQPDFWEKEIDAPILKFNLNGWLQQHQGEAQRRANTWLSSVGVKPSTMDWDRTPLTEEGARIFRADANRTFRSEPNRLLMIKLLSYAQSKFGDYQQSMGYVAGLLLLFFDPPTVFKVLTVMNDSPFYLPGYWRGEATACAVDGYVCFSLLEQAIQAKLLGLGLLPETFVQKWFAGICIHHLPYHILFDFLDQFFARGNSFLFQFFLAFFEEFKNEIMSATSNPEANQMIRFEGVPEERLYRAVQLAMDPGLVKVVGEIDLHRRRCRAYKEKLCDRMQSANEGMWAKRDDDITFSDEED
mmetsp:Transcript_46527/g.108469  ORF Transcript_46527/g.108469 Transcript_46527/m.108469 type:complete len:301 (-) Transcript_46527:87-989(-)